MPTEADAAESEAEAGSSGPDCVAQLRAVSHQYPGDVQALTDINLRFARGTLTVLIGANGSGKSTLLAILAACLSPTHGQVEVLGHHLPLRLGGRAIRRHVRSQIAFVSQAPALDPEMTGRETLSFLAALQGVPRQIRAERVAELAETFDLHSVLTRFTKTYSGGQSRRLHIAAGLLADPALVLLDEPSAGLDAEGSQLLWNELVQRTRRGRTVVAVTHDVLHAQHYADRVVFMHQGKCIADDTPSALTAGMQKEAESLASGHDSRPQPALARIYRRLTGQAIETARTSRADRIPGSGRG